MRKIQSIILLITFLLLLHACNESGKQEATYFKESGERFHTFYHITYESPQPLTEAIDSTMSAFNAVLNVFDSTSVASRFNRNETDELYPMLLDVVREAEKVSRATEGVYDITGAPLFDIWGFGTRKGVTRLATDAEIDSILSFVGYQNLVVDESAGKLRKSDPRLTINPSSLSKGYVTDLVANTLESHGVQNYLVEIGGEVVAKGVNPSGKCWNIGIDRPVPENDGSASDIIFVVPLCEKRGLASSGDYRNFKEIEGRKVAHTIDNRTGYPAHQDILSATVVAPSCMEADAWATAFMALGLEEALKVLDTQPQLAVCFIYEDPQTGELTSYERRLDIREIEKK